MDTPQAHAAPPSPIFIHGSGGDHRVWGHQTACFAGAAVVDLPGHPTGAAVSDPAELADILAGALELIDTPRVIVGHSLGGALALQVAIARPDLVDGLVIIASGARLPVPDRVMRGLAAGFDAECVRLLDGFFAHPGTVALDAAQALVACGPDTLAADYDACRAVDLRPRLAQVRAPTLVIAGADDPFTPPWLSEELARGLPACQMVVVEGVRHMPMIEAPDTVNLLVGAHLTRVVL